MCYTSSPSEDYLTVLAGQRQWIATTNFAGCPGRPPDSFANSAVFTTSAKVPDALGWPIDPCFPVQIDPKAEQFEQVVPWETDGWVCDLGARVAQPGRGGSAPARRTGQRPEHKARRLPSLSNSQHRRILPWGLHRRCRWSPPSSPQPVAYPKSGWWPAPPRTPSERCPPPPDSCTLAGSPFLQVRG